MHEKKSITYQISSPRRCPKSMITNMNEEKKGDSGKMDRRKNISFGHVTVRHYDRTVSDNPSVSSGCAIGLDWKYSRTDHYESTNDFEVNTSSRSLSKLKLDRKKRESILKYDWGIPKPVLASTLRGINATKSRRIRTQHNLKWSDLEERWQGAVKKMKKILRLRKSTKEEIESLWERAGSFENSRKSYKKRSGIRKESMSTLSFSNDSDVGELGLEQSVNKVSD